MAFYDNIIGAVHRAETVMASSAALIAGLAAAIRANMNDPAALQSLADELDGKTTKLSEAVIANTVLAGSGAAPGDTDSSGAAATTNATEGTTQPSADANAGSTEAGTGNNGSVEGNDSIDSGGNSSGSDSLSADDATNETTEAAASSDSISGDTGVDPAPSADQPTDGE